MRTFLESLSSFFSLLNLTAVIICTALYCSFLFSNFWSDQIPVILPLLRVVWYLALILIAFSIFRGMRIMNGEGEESLQNLILISIIPVVILIITPFILDRYTVEVQAEGMQVLELLKNYLSH